MLIDYFEIGNILLIKDYKFENGESKDKILILLVVNKTESFVLQALTTSQDKVPDKKLHHGCTNTQDDLFSFYLFEKDRIIGESGFRFIKNTFIHFQYNISKINTATLMSYSSRFKVFDKLQANEYKRLIKCVLNSRKISYKLKTEFEKIDLSSM
jgi:hypothetical protein